MDEPQDVFELKALLVLGREGSISGAAEKLNISPLDLSQILECLEKKAGKQLLVHHVPCVSLTAEGDEMVDRYINYYLSRLVDVLKFRKAKEETKDNNKCFS
jgi:DNA-binding MarR family transcriptional regulator